MQDIQESQMAELVIKLNLLTIEDTQIIEQGKQLYINFVQTFSSTNCLDYIDWNYCISVGLLFRQIWTWDMRIFVFFTGWSSLISYYKEIIGVEIEIKFSHLMPTSFGT